MRSEERLTLTNSASSPRVHWASKRILRVRPRMAPYIAFARAQARMPPCPTLALQEGDYECAID
jgi:hypothetical protein